MSATPSGPDPHFHRSISESFYILAGSVRIFDGDRWIDTEPGDFVHVPEGGVHAFRNESGEPASMLLHFSPGAPREGYFEGLSSSRDSPRRKGGVLPAARHVLGLIPAAGWRGVTAGWHGGLAWRVRGWRGRHLDSSPE